MADPVAVVTLIASWFTPSSLFILLNLVIGTIAITSRFTNTNTSSSKPQPQPQQLQRSSPSLLQRLNHNHYDSESEPIAAHSPESETHHVEPDPDENHPCPDQEEPKLVRSPSLLQRLRSMSFTTSHGGDEEVDAKADDFINRFKKQLRLQRIDSILRYRRGQNS